MSFTSSPRLIAGISVFAIVAVCSAAAVQWRQETAPVRAFRGGHPEASGVVGVPGTNSVLIVDDGRPRHVLSMELSSQGQVGELVEVAIHADVPDPEDITFDGERFYVMGSQSQGARDADGLVRFRFDPRTLKTSQVERATGLRDFLATSVPELQGGRRRRGMPINIEGLVWDVARSRLLLGLREPLDVGQALVIPLKLKDATQPLSTGNLVVDGPVIHLPLEGRGVRGLGYDTERRTCLLLAGAPESGNPVEFRLYEWDGATAAGLRPLATFPAAQKPEGVTRLTLDGRRRTLVVFDVGGYRLLD